MDIRRIEDYFVVTILGLSLVAPLLHVAGVDRTAGGKAFLAWTLDAVAFVKALRQSRTETRIVAATLDDLTDEMRTLRPAKPPPVPPTPSSFSDPPGVSYTDPPRGSK